VLVGPGLGLVFRCWWCGEHRPAPSQRLAPRLRFVRRASAKGELFWGVFSARCSDVLFRPQSLCLVKRSPASAMACMRLFRTLDTRSSRLAVCKTLASAAALWRPQGRMRAATTQKPATRRRRDHYYRIKQRPVTRRARAPTSRPGPAAIPHAPAPYELYPSSPPNPHLRSRPRRRSHPASASRSRLIVHL
jgi:hypothetical protein